MYAYLCYACASSVTHALFYTLALMSHASEYTSPRVFAMAAHFYLRLLPLKITVRPTTGRSERRVVHPEEGPSMQRASIVAENEPSPPSSPAEIYTEDGPSMRTILKQASASAWGSIRHKLLHAVVEGEAMPESQLCVKCNNVYANLRCQKCGSSAFYCQECFLSLHTNINIFHTAEEWRVSLYCT